MPVMYLETKFDIQVDLSSNADEFTFQQWTDDNLKNERSNYNQPNKGFWFEIIQENINQALLIDVTEFEIYEGIFDIQRNEFVFKFFVNCKAKVNVNKIVKENLNQGRKIKLVGLTINGQQYSVDHEVHIIISSKLI